jgi:hypothetical protein
MLSLFVDHWSHASPPIPTNTQSVSHNSYVIPPIRNTTRSSIDRQMCRVWYQPGRSSCQIIHMHRNKREQAKWSTIILFFIKTLQFLYIRYPCINVNKNMSTEYSTSLVYHLFVTCKFNQRMDRQLTLPSSSFNHIVIYNLSLSVEQAADTLRVKICDFWKPFRCRKNKTRKTNAFDPLCPYFLCIGV